MTEHDSTPTATPPPASTPRRWLQGGSISLAVALLVVALGGILLAIRVGDDGGDGGGSSLLADWTDATEREGTYRFTMKQSVTGSGAPKGLDELFSLEGAVDTRAKLARTVTSISVLGANTKCTYITKEPDIVYVNVHESRRAEFGAPWLRSNVTAALAGVGFPLRPDELDDDPDRYFEQLEENGNATVGGVRTTRYSGEFDLGAIYSTAAGASQLPTDFGERVPVDVYMDDEDLVRRIQLKVSSTNEISIGFTIDFSDYGEPVDLKEPSGTEVKQAAEAADISTACFPATLGARE